MFSLIFALNNNWANNGDAGDLRRHRARYDVIVMMLSIYYIFYMESIWWLVLTQDIDDCSGKIGSQFVPYYHEIFQIIIKETELLRWVSIAQFQTTRLLDIL